MKIEIIILLLILFQSIYSSSVLKMVFNVEYDKSAHKYNLVINKKTKADEKLKKLIDKKKHHTYSLMVSKYNKIGRQLKRALSKRKGLTTSKKIQNILENLNQKINSTLLKSNDQAKLDINKSYDSVQDMYNNSTEQFNGSCEEFKHKSANEQDTMRTAIVKQLGNDYNKQNNALQRKLLAIKNSLHNVYQKISKQVHTILVRIKKKEQPINARRLVNNNNNDALRIAELKAYDNKIDRYSRELGSIHLLKRLKGLFNIQNSNTKRFLSSIKKVATISDNSYSNDPLTLVGLKGNPRVLSALSKLVKLTPPWLSYTTPHKITDKSKSDVAKYKKAMIKQTIKDIKSHKWTIVNKNNKKYAYIRRLDLYVPTDKKSHVNDELINSLVLKLKNNYAKLGNKKGKNTSIQDEKSQSDGNNDRKQMNKQKKQILNKAIGNSTSKYDLPAPKMKFKSKKRKLFVGTAIVAGTMGVAGMAAGAMGGMDESEKIRRAIMDTEDLLNTQGINDRFENNNFNKLFMAKVRLKRAVHYILSLNKQFIIRLDAKRDDLMHLTSEQEIY